MLRFDLFFIVTMLFISPSFANDFYSKFHQKDYKLEFQRLVLVSYEKSVCNWVEIKTFKLNRTFTAFNMSFNCKKDMGSDIEVIVQVYKFLSNEYRIFPIRFEVNLCKSFNENVIGARAAYNCGNFPTCIIRKNTTYKVCNMYLDESRFPPLIPNGEYKARCTLELPHEEQVLIMDYYMKIYRPITIKEKKNKKPMISY